LIQENDLIPSCNLGGRHLCEDFGVLVDNLLVLWIIGEGLSSLSGRENDGSNTVKVEDMVLVVLEGLIKRMFVRFIRVRL
jgi:hypothetical protein